MLVSVRMQSKIKGELNKFLSKFYNTNLEINNEKVWINKYNNPIEMIDLIGTFIDNSDEFNIKMWINLDPNIYIKITKENANIIIKYLFERYPY